MIFRWSIWGLHKEKSSELLRYSILSFKKQFGKSHRYIIYTDSPHELEDKFNKIAEVLDFRSSDNEYDIDSVTTWRKWCPTARMDITETEFYIDSDVFLLKYPEEVDEFIKNPKLKFGILDEFKGQPWQHGAMQKKGVREAPFVNAGFFVQKAGYDISSDLIKEFEWWKKNIENDEQTHHDEQGALAIALTKYSMSGELYVLPKDNYILIGENENRSIQDLEDITLLHAVYPDHPAFYKFKYFLDKILNE
ncbi:hypothetical protein COU58_02015 [Candidatus Pacearchaeota archaeon CG10_big_fil_rev_8_21_14_0_10_32_42]|nr:MAG: hypothetical protein COU58_02015 [Candidatus Pacearchaeota archaeon CG10_big_fil_rev_8_21_14_0_10_32_42]